jgi:alkylation response protein AidB-like acyl-CoA dehydrogenase
MRPSPLARDEAPAAEPDAVAVAASLAERFRSRADVLDRENRFARENFEEIRSAGLGVLPLPQQYGGAGHGLADVCHIVRRLAHGCAPTALALNMHLMTLGSLVERWKIKRDLSWVAMRAIADRRLFVAAAMSEPETGSDFLCPRTSLTPRAGKLLLNGRKVFGTLSPIADMFAVTARQGDQLAFVLVPPDAPGFTVRETWNALGMRATGSHDLVFEGVEVSPKAVFHSLPLHAVDSVVLAGVVWFEATLAAVYLGLIEQALDFTRTALAPAVDRTSPTAQARILTMELGALEETRRAVAALVSEAAEAWDAGGDESERLAASVAAKTYAVREARRVVDGCMSLVGGRSYAQSCPLSRLYRDARAGGFHPLSERLSHELLGWVGLGRPVARLSNATGIA